MGTQTTLIRRFVAFATTLAFVSAACGPAAPSTAAPPPEGTPTELGPTAEKTAEATLPPIEGTPVPVDFDGIPTPERCVPDQPQLVKAADLQRVPLERNPYLDGGVGEAVTITNDLGQDFQLSVFGQDLAAIDAFLNEVQVCFEALPGGPPSGFDQGSVTPPDDVLLATVIKETGLSREELIARREALIKERGVPDEDGLGISLTQIMEALTPAVDAQGVLDQATKTAVDQIDAAEAGGSLAPEQAKALRALIQEQGFYLQLLEDPEATLLDERIDEQADYGKALEDTENLIVDMEWLNPPKGEAKNFVVFFVIDPRLYQGQTKFYNWLLRTYVWTQITVTEGYVCVTLYRWNGTSISLGQRCAAAGQTTPPLSGYSSIAKWYSAQTRGVYFNGGRGNYYRIYGYWRED